MYRLLFVNVQVLFCTVPFSVYSIFKASLQQHFVVCMFDTVTVVFLATPLTVSCTALLFWSGLQNNKPNYTYVRYEKWVIFSLLFNNLYFFGSWPTSFRLNSSFSSLYFRSGENICVAMAVLWDTAPCSLQK